MSLKNSKETRFFFDERRTLIIDANKYKLSNWGFDVVLILESSHPLFENFSPFFLISDSFCSLFYVLGNVNEMAEWTSRIGVVELL